MPSGAIIVLSIYNNIDILNVSPHPVKVEKLPVKLPHLLIVDVLRFKVAINSLETQVKMREIVQPVGPPRGNVVLSR